MKTYSIGQFILGKKYEENTETLIFSVLKKEKEKAKGLFIFMICKKNDYFYLYEKKENPTWRDKISKGKHIKDGKVVAHSLYFFRFNLNIFVNQKSRCS